MKRYFPILLLALLSTGVMSADLERHLHINSGAIYSIDSVLIPVLIFNQSEQFSPDPAIISVAADDQLTVWFHNHDTIAHTLILAQGDDQMQLVVQASDSASASLTSDDLEVVRVFDENPAYKYAGLATMIVFEAEGDRNFYWNIREYKVGLTEQFEEPTDTYEPEYFTINNRSAPRTMMDPLGRITGKIGEVINVYIYNAGLMHHNVHLHGYHAEIIYSSRAPETTGRSKDSIPVDVNEALVIQLVPHQAGMFPIHNHNLGATLGNNIYPNGMVSQINISAQ